MNIFIRKPKVKSIELSGAIEQDKLDTCLYRYE